MSRHARDDSQEGIDEPLQQLMIPAPPSSVGESTSPSNTAMIMTIHPLSHDSSSSGGNTRSTSRYAAFSTQQNNPVGILRPLSSDDDEDNDEDDDNADNERRLHEGRSRHEWQIHQQQQRQVGYHHPQASPPRYMASPYAQLPQQFVPAYQSPFSSEPRTELNSPSIPSTSSSTTASSPLATARTSGHGREYRHNHHHHGREGRIAAQQQQPLRPDQSPPLPLSALPPPTGRLQPTRSVQTATDLEYRRTLSSQPPPSLPSLRQPAVFPTLPSRTGRQPLLADPEAPYSIPAPPRNVMAGHGGRADHRIPGVQFDTKESGDSSVASGSGGSRDNSGSMSYARQGYAGTPTVPLPPMVAPWQQQQPQQSPLLPRNIPPPAPPTSSTMMMQDRREDEWAEGSSTVSRHDPGAASTVRSRRLAPAPYRGEQSASSPSLTYPGDRDLTTASTSSYWPGNRQSRSSTERQREIDFRTPYGNAAMAPSYSSSLPLAPTGASLDDHQRQVRRMATDPSSSGYYSDQSGETATTSYFRDTSRHRAPYDDREQQEERMFSSRAGPLPPLMQYDEGSFSSGRIYRDDGVQGQDIPGLSPYDHQGVPNQRIPARPEFVQSSSRISSSAYAPTAGRAAPYTHPPPPPPPPRLAAHHDQGGSYPDFMHHQQQQHSHPSSGGFPYMNVPYPGSSFNGPPVLSSLPPHPQMMSRQTSAGSSDHGNLRARAKVDVACDICRKSKARCDGVRPVCGPCATQKKPCHYQEGPPRRRGPGKNPKGSSKSRQRKQQQQQQQEEAISASGAKNEESSSSKHAGSETTATLLTTSSTAEETTPVGGRSGSCSSSSSTGKGSPAAHPRAGSLSEGSAEPLLPAHHATPAPFYHHHHHHHQQSHQPHHHHHQAVPVPAPDQGLPAVGLAPGSPSPSATTAGASSSASSASAFAMDIDATAATAAAAAYSMFDAVSDVDNDDYAQLLSPPPVTTPLGRRRRRGSGTDGEGDGAQSDRSAKLYRNGRTD